ncbi:hypothetical protein ACFL18_02090 [Patescibacteria group bacterium]
MHPKAKKFIIFLTLIVLALAIFFLRQKNLSTPNPTPSPAITISTPTSVVENFMKATLGMIPNADIDYDKARTLMTTSYAAEFTDSMFIPLAYGMQDGPTSVEVTNEEILTNTATVTVLGHWGPENQMYWKFELEKEAGDWKLNFINPGQ